MFADNLAITIQTLITYYPVILVHMEKKSSTSSKARFIYFSLMSWVDEIFNI